MIKFENELFFENSLKEWNNSAVLNSLLGVTKEQVLLIDKEGKIVFANTEVFGVTPEKAIGESIFKLTPSIYLLILKHNLTEVNKTKKESSFEIVFKLKDQIKSNKIKVKPILSNKGAIQGFALTSIDNTEIKSSHAKISYKTNLEKLFLTISTKFINLPATDIDNGIIESLELIGRFTNSSHAFIVLGTNALKQIDYQWHASSKNKDDEQCSLRSLDKLLGKTVKNLNLVEPLLIKPNEKKYNLGNDCPVFINPMTFEKKQYGALILLGKIEGEQDWSEDFAKPMVLLTNIFINALERKRNTKINEQGKEKLEKAIQQRTVEIQIQKNKLLQQSEELKKAETLVRKVNTDLKKANLKLEKTVSKRTSSLEKSNQELDRFVYSVSHDIKAPLASVKGLINLIRLSKNNNELDFNLQLMDRSINKLNGFVEDILTYSRNSRVALKHDLINFEDEIELAAEDLRHMDNASNVQLITSINIESAPVTDQYRIQSVLKNLISNAVKYHSASVKNSWVKIHVHSKQKEIKIRVVDNGIGICKQSIGKIFDMFYRASEKSFGSGLGLYIVKETIDKIGGTIKVASKEGIGSTFEIKIPNLA